MGDEAPLFPFSAQAPEALFGSSAGTLLGPPHLPSLAPTCYPLVFAPPLQMYYRGKMFGFVHLYNGQEAVSTGVIRCLRKDDYICSTYRDHVHSISKARLA